MDKIISDIREVARIIINADIREYRGLKRIILELCKNDCDKLVKILDMHNCYTVFDFVEKYSEEISVFGIANITSPTDLYGRVTYNGVTICEISCKAEA